MNHRVAIAHLVLTALMLSFRVSTVVADPLFGANAEYATGSHPWAVAIGDLNGDGRLDLAVANYFSSTVSVLLGSGIGTFAAKTDFVVGSLPFSVAIADLNGDGKPDLATANYDANTVSVLLGNGNGTFGARTDFATGGGPFSVAIGDLNGDGIPDLVVANSGAITVSVLLGNGNGTFGARTDFATAIDPISVAIWDLNGDGKPDLVTANYNSNTVSVLLGNGAGSFPAKADYGTGSGAEGVAIGDLNGDGNSDLAVANTNANTVSVLLGNGNGTFAAKMDSGTGDGPQSVAIGDVNGDGKPDMVTANTRANTVAVLLGNGNGTFSPRIEFSTGSGPFSVAIGDLNGDGKPDLATANYGSSTASVLLATPAPHLTITANAAAGGAIYPSGAVGVPFGANQTFTIAVDSCHTITAVTVDGSGVGALTTYTFTNVQSSHTISAAFGYRTSPNLTTGRPAIASAAEPQSPPSLAFDGDTLTAWNAGGYAPQWLEVDLGADLPVTCMHLFVGMGPNGYVVHTIVGRKADGTQVPLGGFSGQAYAGEWLDIPAADQTPVRYVRITTTTSPSWIAWPEFQILGPAGSYVITASAGAGGTISPSGTVLVSSGGSQALSITPDACNSIADVRVDGASLGPLAAYTFTNVSDNHTIAATFALGGHASSFEGPIASSSGQQYPGYGPVDDWTQVPFPSGFGPAPYLSGANTSTGPFWNNGVVPGGGTGGHVAFVEVYAGVTSMSLQQALSTMVPGGSYQLSYDENARQGYPAPMVEVLVDGIAIVARHLDPVVGGSNPFRVVTSSPFTTSSASALVLFRVSQASPGDDATALIDNVKILRLNDPSVAAVPHIEATQIKTGNAPTGTTKIALAYSSQPGVTVEVWRKGFGGYPTYDNSGGSIPSVPVAYPPDGWALTGVTASGQTDEPSTRDFWYYVAYAKDACGNVSVVSSMTRGTLNYHLGDVSNGITPGQGDNKISTPDVSLLGAHYGITGGALAGAEYLDVGPTTTGTVDGRPTTDAKVNFEDLVLYAINFTPHVSLVTKGGTITQSADEVSFEAPASVTTGDEFAVDVQLMGAGDLVAISTTLGWNAAVVTPLWMTAGDLVTSQNGVAFSASPGNADAALLGTGSGFTGQGTLATFRFRAIAGGDPRISIAQVSGRDTKNRSIPVENSNPRATAVSEHGTELMPVVPNPMRADAAVQYSLATRSVVDLAIYSVDGRRVKSLVGGLQEAGRYSSVWSGDSDGGNHVAAGVYFVRLTLGGRVFTRPLVRAE